MSAGPLLTSTVHAVLRAASRAGIASVRCSLDLNRSESLVGVRAAHWEWEGERFPYLRTCKDRTIYHWTGEAFQPVTRFAESLIKLVPTEWGPPTFEIDGIKMLPTSRISPYEDAEVKVGYVQPRGKVVLDTCGGLGYFAAWCLRGQATRVLSYEKNPDVLWLRGINPWSPEVGGSLNLVQGDITQEVGLLAGGSVDAILHDPPRFGLAGELYSQVFYESLTRVLRRKGKLFHYTGSPNKLTSGRDVPNEVANRLRRVGFSVELKGDGVLARKL